MPKGVYPRAPYRFTDLKAYLFERSTPQPNGCILWNLTINPKHGYGTARWQKRYWRTHRLAWFACHGVDPDNLVLHTCDVRACINPAHLYLGDAGDNIRDTMARSPTYRIPPTCYGPGKRQWVHR